jgi:hypothetical protein
MFVARFIIQASVNGQFLIYGLFLGLFCVLKMEIYDFEQECVCFKKLVELYSARGGHIL